MIVVLIALVAVALGMSLWLIYEEGDVPVSREADVGATDAEFESAEPGKIVGLILTDGPWAESLIIDVSPTEDEDSETWGELHDSWIREDGSFTVDDLPAGLYTVEIIADSGPVIEPLRGVVVRPGIPSDEEHLLIDLRGSLHRFVVHLVDPDGIPVEGIEYTYRFPLDLEGYSGGSANSYGSRVDLLSHYPSVDIVVSASGCRARRIQDLRGETTVALEPGLPVRFVLKRPEEVPAPPFLLTAALLHRGEKDAWFPIFLSSDEEGVASGVLSYPGRYQMEIVVESDEDGAEAVQQRTAGYTKRTLSRAARERRIACTPESVEVQDLATEQVFILDVPTEAIKRHTEAARRNG